MAGLLQFLIYFILSAIADSFVGLKNSISWTNQKGEFYYRDSMVRSHSKKTFMRKSVVLRMAEGFQLKEREYFRHPGSYATKDLQAITEKEQPPTSKKISCLLLFGYEGGHFNGSRLSEYGSMPTVESEMERALFKAGYVRRRDYGNLQRLNWKLTSRTDPEVSAVAQVASIRTSLPGGAQKVVERVNEHLPESIRCFDLVQTSKSFNAMTSCTKRRYQYLLPTYMLKDHLEVKQIFQDTTEEGSANSSALPSVDLGEVHDRLSAYRVDNSTLSRLKQSLQVFTGAHNFHNFAYQKGVTDPSAMRYISRFKVSDPFLVKSTTSISQNQQPMKKYEICTPKNMIPPSSMDSPVSIETSPVQFEGVKYEEEWVVVEIVGKSFMHHQIRKMLATAVDFARRKDTIMSKQVIDKEKEKAREIARAKLKTKEKAMKILDRVKAESQVVIGEDGALAGASAQVLEEGESIDLTSPHQLNGYNEATLKSTLEGGHRITTPLLPGTGLYLDRAYFEDYNTVLKQKCQAREQLVLSKMHKFKCSDKSEVEQFAWKNKHLVSWEEEETKHESIAENGEEKGSDVGKDSSLEVKSNQQDDNTEVVISPHSQNRKLKIIEVNRQLKQFKSQRLWPHIFNQASSSLSFVKWLKDINNNPLVYSIEAKQKAVPSGRLRLDRKNIIAFENTEELNSIRADMAAEREKRRLANSRKKGKGKSKKKK